MKIDWSHFQNYALWVAIAAFLLLVLQACGINVNPTQYNALWIGFLSILVLLGIINNPSSQSTTPLQPKPIDTLRAPGSKVIPSAFQTGEQVLAESTKAP